MSALRRFAMGFVIAAVLGIGLQTATLEAKKPGPSSQDAICAYLWSVITYPNVSPWIQDIALQLFTSYGCTAPQ